MNMKGAAVMLVMLAVLVARVEAVYKLEVRKEEERRWERDGMDQERACVCVCVLTMTVYVCMYVCMYLCMYLCVLIVVIVPL